MPNKSYGTLKKCPKCGSKNILRTYVQTDFLIIGLACKEIPEYMKINCGFCKYSTQENCLDFKEEKQ